MLKKLLCCFRVTPHFGKDREVESCCFPGGSAVTGSLFAKLARFKGAWVEARCSAGL